MNEIDSLKRYVDNLSNTLRQSEKDLYDKIDNTNSNVAELNTSVKLVVDKLSTFIDNFKKHDENEMQKYDTILNMFKEVKSENKKMEDSIKKDFVSKKDFSIFEKMLEDNNKAIKNGFKIFYIGSGIMLTIAILSSGIMYIFDLISQIQTLKGI